MTDFSFLDSMAVTNERTSELTLHSITLPNGKSPTLIGRHGGQTNKPYFNALLKGGAKKVRAVNAGKVNIGMIEENRNEDRGLYPQHVITGWKDVCDARAEDVSFSKDACTDFLKHLPDHIFDEVRNYFGNPDNFMGEIPSEEEARVQGKR